jgi:hypothetical protein
VAPSAAVLAQTIRSSESNIATLSGDRANPSPISVCAVARFTVPPVVAAGKHAAHPLRPAPPHPGVPQKSRGDTADVAVPEVEGRCTRGHLSMAVHARATPDQPYVARRSSTLNAGPLSFFDGAGVPALELTEAKLPEGMLEEQLLRPSRSTSLSPAALLDDRVAAMARYDRPRTNMLYMHSVILILLYGQVIGVCSTTGLPALHTNPTVARNRLQSTRAVRRTPNLSKAQQGDYIP